MRTHRDVDVDVVPAYRAPKTPSALRTIFAIASPRRLGATVPDTRACSDAAADAADDDPCTCDDYCTFATLGTFHDRSDSRDSQRLPCRRHRCRCFDWRVVRAAPAHRRSGSSAVAAVIAIHDDAQMIRHSSVELLRRCDTAVRSVCC